jgi:hypothetical protein
VATPTYAPASFGQGGAPPLPLDDELVVEAAEELVAVPPVPAEDDLPVLPVDDELAPPLPAE